MLLSILSGVVIVVALQSETFAQGAQQEIAEIQVPRELPSQQVLSALPAAEAAKLRTSPVPVLLLRNPNDFADAQFDVTEMYYSAFFNDQAHSISIQGSRLRNSHRLRSPSGRVLNRIRATRGFITQSQGIWTASWKEFGAAYLVTIECTHRQDTRCKSADYITRLANSLVYVGGGDLSAELLLQANEAFRSQRLLSGLAETIPEPIHDFPHKPAGQLLPRSGRGRRDTTVYAPDIRFPLENKPDFANSQVWNPGGSNGPAHGAQCARSNYSFPWRDNFCESRARGTPMCPSGKGHQGQDIRPSTCEKNKYFVVSATSGRVTHIGSYSVFITASDGTQFRYLHMGNVSVKVHDAVTKGQRIGQVSNVFNETPTTIHLHFEIVQNVAQLGFVQVPPYTSLVLAYKRLP
jgi:murein DD-endopeptidase MepM/ murein hydrolase activator NlpD